METIDAKEAWRYFKLLEASWHGKSLELEGVKFQLEHPELPRNAWQPTTILGNFVHQRTPHAPRLAMPWMQSFELEWLRALGEQVAVHRGDTVVIDAVTVVPVHAINGDLDHPQHRERRWATVKIVRASGSEVAVAQAWQFRGLTDVMSPIEMEDYQAVYWAMLKRLEQALELESADDITLADSRADWIDATRDASELNRRAADALWACRLETGEEAGAAMALGYLIGRAEADELLLPLARRRLEVSAKMQANAKQPRAPGDLTRKAALEILKASPNLSRRKCAERTATARKLTDVKSVEDTISRLFRKGDDGRWWPDAIAIAAERARLNMEK